MSKPYRVIDRETGDIEDFDNAIRVVDYLFVKYGLFAFRQVWIYKNRRLVDMPKGGSADEIAQWLARRA